MKIIEKFICGKKDDPALCEDIIVITADFCAVIDGATTKRAPQVAGKAAGRFAAETVAAGIADFPPDITGKAAIDRLSDILREKGSAALAQSAGAAEKPSCCLAIYSKARREIWRLGDIGILINGRPDMAPKAIDDIASTARAAMIQALLLEGETIETLQAHDKARDFILPLLEKQHLFANLDEAGFFGYGVLNGDRVPEHYVDIISVPAGAEIVIASDGYPVLQPSLAESEDLLRQVIAEDPLLCRQHLSTKGRQAGQVSFDDRSYLRFAV